MGVCCSKRMKKRRLGSSDLSSSFSESDSRDESSQNSSDSRKNRTSFSRQSSSRKKANKPSTKGRTSSSAATTGTTNDKGRSSSPSTRRPAATVAPVKVNLPRPQLSKIQANAAPINSAIGTQSTMTSKYYLPARDMPDANHGLLLVPRDNSTQVHNPPQAANGQVNGQQEYFYYQEAYASPQTTPLPVNIETGKQWSPQPFPATTTALYQNQQTHTPFPHNPVTHTVQQVNLQQQLPPPPPMMVSSPMAPASSPATMVYGKNQMINSQPTLFPAPITNPNEQSTKLYVKVAIPSSIVPPPFPAPQVLSSPPPHIQQTFKYLYKKADPSPVKVMHPYSAGQAVQMVSAPLPPMPAHQPASFNVYQEQQYRVPLSPPNAPPAVHGGTGGHYNAYTYQHTQQVQQPLMPANMCLPATGAIQTGEQENRLSTEEHFEVLRRDIRELKDIVKAQDTKEMVSKMDKCLEMFKKVSKVYRALNEDIGLQTKLGRNDSIFGKSMSQIKNCYDDLSSKIHLFSTNTQKMIKHVKRDPGSSTSNDQLSSLVNPQELTQKMDEMVRLMDTLKTSYSPEIMKTLTNKDN